MESPSLDQLCTSYKIQGNDEVEKLEFKTDNPNGPTGDVYINKKQYFGDVPKVAWEFYIGGYQPAQKWLKDRKRQKLTTDNLIHYQKIIVALKKTAEIMTEIDNLIGTN